MNKEAIQSKIEILKATLISIKDNSDLVMISDDAVETLNQLLLIEEDFKKGDFEIEELVEIFEETQEVLNLAFSM